ncbi:MAG TPA: iron-sulfur cluster insertion protein ErpA, partial [Rhodospirillaceae bacterium]|nr:iron-sulfur cluster insertion protein ErpA [Rhodospirillaceae bacterium]
MNAILADHHVRLTESAAMRVKTLREMEGDPQLMLRLAVNGGGCSGFSYQFTLDSRRNDDDMVFEQHGVCLVVDGVSLEMLDGSVIDFVEDLMGSAFSVTNPNASSSCGC